MPGGNSKLVKDLAIKMPEVEKQITGIKNEMKKINIEQVKDQLQEIYSILEKKANVLELKKNTYATDEVSSQISGIVSDMKDIKQSDFVGEKGKATSSLIKRLETGIVNQDVKIQRLIQNYTEMSAKLGDSLKLMMIGNSKPQEDHQF